MQVKQSITIAALLMVLASTNAYCAQTWAASLASAASTIANHPQGQDVLAGIAAGPASRVVGRAIYTSIGNASQNGALLCTGGMLGLCTAARALAGGSNIALNLAVGILSAALTLN